MKRKHLLEMRQSGWFDFMVLLLILGAVLLGAWAFWSAPV